MRGQILAEFEVILEEDAPDVSALVLANRRRDPRERIEAPTFVMRRIVEEVPNIEEAIAGHAATRTFWRENEPCNPKPNFTGFASSNLRYHILQPSIPLVPRLRAS